MAQDKNDNAAEASELEQLRESLRDTTRLLRQMERRHESARSEIARTEADLRRSEERYAMATSAAVEGIYEWNVEAGTLFLTDRAKSFFAISGEELAPAAWNMRIHSEDYPAYRAAIVEHFKGRAPLLEHEYRIADERGTYRWVLDRGIGVRNVRGRVVRVVGALSDITARKNVELDLRRARDQAEEALERQTATAEILKVIGRSAFDLQRVFEALIENAVHLCGAERGVVFRFDGALLRYAVGYRVSPKLQAFFEAHPIAPDRDSNAGRAMVERRTVHNHDVRSDPEYRYGGHLVDPYRTVLAVPMLKGADVLGVILIYRHEVRPFNENQIKLVETFADQAGIAIENTRLFEELSRSVRELRALGEVGRAVSSTLDLDTVLLTIASRATELTGMDGGGIYEYDEATKEFHLRATRDLPDELVEALREAPIRKGEGAMGQLAATGRPAEVRDITDEAVYQSRVRELLVRLGYRSLLAVPLLWEDRLLGGLVVSRKAAGDFSPRVVELLQALATQSALAIQNARLFREIEDKSRRLEEASRHKSQFLASMSHELRTPLNAILGFNEMILGGIYGEVPEGMKEPLQDIQASGRNLLRLINNVLDLAKIEAGRMELALVDYAVQDVVQSVRATVWPLAAAKGLHLVVDVPDDLPVAFGDPGRIGQCLVNLAGNALKFTPAGGVEIAVARRDGMLVFRVSDTGIGIPPDKIEILFSEFRQTDAAIATEYGGSGLGLAITKKFVEMHGGSIRAESRPGAGSVFTFEVPLRACAAASS